MHAPRPTRTSPSATAVAALAASLGFAGACGPSATDQASANDAGAALSADDTFVGCTTDSRADVYRAGLTKPSQDGQLQITLLGSDPAPPAFGANTWTIRVEDGAGAPVPGATIVATPFMPDHGHGSSILPAVTDAGDGTYRVSLFLSMAGLWRIGLAVSPSDAGLPSTVNFFYCIQR